MIRSIVEFKLPYVWICMHVVVRTTGSLVLRQRFTVYVGSYFLLDNTTSLLYYIDTSPDLVKFSCFDMHFLGISPDPDLSR